MSRHILGELVNQYEEAMKDMHWAEPTDSYNSKHNAYLEFVEEQRKLRPAPQLGIIAERWHALTRMDRAQYITRALEYHREHKELSK